jgi:hypothetical protein
MVLGRNQAPAKQKPAKVGGLFLHFQYIDAVKRQALSRSCYCSEYSIEACGARVTFSSG